jgi:hypothetical protein
MGNGRPRYSGSTERKRAPQVMALFAFRLDFGHDNATANQVA